MATTALLLDLDQTLMVEDASVDAALLATCRHAGEQYGIDARGLSQAVRRHAGELWRASTTIGYCSEIGISSWEGLWAGFVGDDPSLKMLRQWAPAYRLEAWSRALAEQGVRDASFAEQLADTFIQERRSRHVLFPDVEPALKNFFGSYRLALITNGVPDIQREKIEAAHIAQYFKAIVISGDHGFGKPDRRMFTLALDRLGISPDAAVMVGDNPVKDVAAAQQAGIRGIWLNRAGADCPPGVTPDARISSLSELRGVIQ